MTELSVSVSLEHSEDGPRTLVRLAGEADVTTPALAQVLGAEAAKKPRLLLIDVSALTFLDSSALHEIVRVHRELSADGCLLALIGPTPAVTRILQLSGLDQVIPVYAAAQEADTQLRSIRPVDHPGRPAPTHLPLARIGPPAAGVDGKRTYPRLCPESPVLR